MAAAGAPLAQTKNSYCGDTKHVDFSFSFPFIPQKSTLMQIAKQAYRPSKSAVIQ